MKNNIFYLIVGSIVTGFIFYNRFIKVRLPKELFPLSPEKIYFIMIMISIMGLLLLYLSYLLYRTIYTNAKETILKTLFKRISFSKYNPSNIITNSLQELDYYIKSKLPMYDHRLSYSMFLMKQLSLWLINNSKLILIIIFSLRIVTQIILIVTFTYEVFFTYKLDYFYKFLILLIIPLAVRYILYSIKTFIYNNLEELNKLLEIYIVTKSSYNPEDNFTNSIKIDIYTWHEMILSGENNNYVSIELLTTDPVYNLPEDQEDFLHTRRILEHYEKYKILLELPMNILRTAIYLTG